MAGMAQQQPVLGVQKALSPLATKLSSQASLSPDCKAISPSHQEPHVLGDRALLGSRYSSSLCTHGSQVMLAQPKLRPQLGAHCHVHGEQP